jgi:hypothetical protein
MKTILLLSIGALFLWFGNKETKQPASEVKTVSAVTVDTVNYQADIQPIFEKHCSPCHFPGGKMYQKLPFDKGETIIDHEAGILKRIKEEKEVALIKQYILQQIH